MGQNLTMDAVAQSLKEFALAKLKQLQEYKQIEHEWKQAAKAYRELTGESLVEAGTEAIAGRGAGRIGRPRGSQTELGYGGKAAAVREWMKEHHEGTAAEIAAAIGTTAKGLSTTLKGLRNRGELIAKPIPGVVGKKCIWGLNDRSTKVKAASTPKSKEPLTARKKARTKAPKGSSETAVLSYLASNGLSSAVDMDKKLDVKQVRSCLARLQNKEFVSRQDLPEGIRWSLLPAGKNFLANGIASH